MALADIINGSFEAGGAIALCFNVARILRDRRVAGVHWLPTGFFFAWGLWNLFYYRHLDQSFSWLAGMAVVLVNFVYLALMLHFIRQQKVA